MDNLWLPPIVEDSPSPYNPEQSKLFVKAFRLGEDGNLYDLFHPSNGYQIGDSIRKQGITMLSASTDKETSDEYLKYAGVDRKDVVQARIQSDDFYEMNYRNHGTSGEVRLNRYRIVDIIPKDDTE